MNNLVIKHEENRTVLYFVEDGVFAEIIDECEHLGSDDTTLEQVRSSIDGHLSRVLKEHIDIIVVYGGEAYSVNINCEALIVIP